MVLKNPRIWRPWKSMNMKIKTKMEKHLTALKSANPADLKIHENQDQNENHSAAPIHKKWHFGLKKHEEKTRFRLLSIPHWPDSLQLGKPTRCSLESFALQLLLLPAMCCQQLLLCHSNALFPNLPHAIFFQHLMLSICSYIESSWMNTSSVDFFLASPNGLMFNIFCHWEQLNGLSLVWVLSCISKWLDIEYL